MNNDTATTPPPDATEKQSKTRDKVLGFGCLLPLMLLGAYAAVDSYLRHSKSDSRNDATAQIAIETKGNAVRAFTAADADYYIKTIDKLIQEADELFAAQAPSLAQAGEPKAFEPDPLKHGKVKAKGLLDELQKDFGIDPRLRNEGTAKLQIASSLLHLLTAWQAFIELRAAKTDDAVKTSTTVFYAEIRASRHEWGQAEQSTLMGKL